MGAGGGGWPLSPSRCLPLGAPSLPLASVGQQGHQGLDFPGSVDPSDQKKTACYDIDVEVEEPLKGQMSSFLLSTANQQEISALDSKIHETIESINQLKIQRDFMLSFSRDPKGYIQDLLRSQSRDLKVKGTQGAREHGNPAPAPLSKDPAAQAGAGAVAGCAQHLGALGTSAAVGPWAPALSPRALPSLLMPCGRGGDRIKGHSSDGTRVVTGNWGGRRKGQAVGPSGQFLTPPAEPPHSICPRPKNGLAEDTFNNIFLLKKIQQQALHLSVHLAWPSWG